MSLERFDSYEGGDQLPREAREQIQQFDFGRKQFYDWLAVQTVTLPELDDIQGRIVVSMQNTAEMFSSSAVCIKHAVEKPAVQEQLITRNWINDDRERVTLFSQLMPNVNFVPISEVGVITEVHDVLHGMADDISMADAFGEMYYTTLWQDVELFLTNIMCRRQSRSSRYGLQQDETLETTAQLIPSSAYLRALSERYGRWALSAMAVPEEKVYE